METRDKLQMDAKAYKELQAAYNKAVREKADSFTFQGATLVTSYAKYLIEHLKSKFATIR